MGGVVLLGGGALLTALLFKGANEIKENNVQAPTSTQVAEQKSTPPKMEEMQSLQPVTVDIETEKRLLEEQKRERERALAEQQAKTQKYLAQQQQAEAAAAKKAAQEYAQINARRAREQGGVDIPPETVEQNSKKNKDTPSVSEEQRQAEIAKKRQADADAKKQAEAKEKKRKALEDAKKAEIEQKKKLEREEAKKTELEHKRKADREEAKRAEQEKQASTEKPEQKPTVVHKDKLESNHSVKHTAEDNHAATKTELDHKRKAEADKARQLMEESNTDKKWMVQVALAVNQANADDTVAKLKAKGYKITTSPTSKGIRIMVGPSKTKEHADNLRKKIQADQSLGMPSAWVIGWVPLDQR